MKYVCEFCPREFPNSGARHTHARRTHGIVLPLRQKHGRSTIGKSELRNSRGIVGWQRVAVRGNNANSQELWTILCERGMFRAKGSSL